MGWTIKETLLHIVIEYGYIGLFGSMALGILGLPIPDETILTFVGYLVFKKDLLLIPAIFSAFFGSITGISISFLLGRTFGAGLLNKSGYLFHLTGMNLEKTKKWLDRYGNWFFIFGYFLPGIRHITALTAGGVRINYFKFAMFAYTGGFLWSCTFILAGYFVGTKSMAIIERIHHHFLILMGIIIFLIVIYFLLRNKFIRNKSI